MTCKPHGRNAEQKNRHKRGHVIPFILKFKITWNKPRCWKLGGWYHSLGAPGSEICVQKFGGSTRGVNISPCEGVKEVERAEGQGEQ